MVGVVRTRSCDHPRTGWDHHRRYAAGPAARPLGTAAPAHRGAALRRGPRRACHPGHRAGTGPGCDCDQRPLHRLVHRLSGRRAPARGGRGRGAVAVGHPGPGPRPHDPARPARRDRPASGPGTGRYVRLECRSGRAGDQAHGRPRPDRGGTGRLPRTGARRVSPARRQRARPLCGPRREPAAADTAQ